MASLTVQSHSPYDELGRSCPARYMASWVVYVMLVIWRAGKFELIDSWLSYICSTILFNPTSFYPPNTTWKERLVTKLLELYESSLKIQEINLGRPTLHKAQWSKILRLWDKFTRPHCLNSLITKSNNLASKHKQQFWLRTSANKPKHFFVIRLRQNPCDATLQARKHFNHEIRHKENSTVGTARRH